MENRFAHMDSPQYLVERVFFPSFSLKQNQKSASPMQTVLSAGSVAGCFVVMCPSASPRF